jgi:TIGR03009 family protein
MQSRFLAYVLLGFLTIAVPALAQPNPLRAPQPSGTTTAPDQSMRSQTPTLVPRARQMPAEQPPAPPQPPPPPFTLTPQEEAQLDRVLNQWEQRNRDVKTFDCKFKRWVFDSVFNPPQPNQLPQPAFTELGTIKYAAPDRGLFRIEQEEKAGKVAPIDDTRADHWVSDGKSIFIFKPKDKQLIEQKLPPELQGKAIADGPLPFVFGAEAQKLKQRYFIRLLPPPPNVTDQIWLEAYPRFQEDAANFHHARFIITAQGMSPFALQLFQPNGKDYTSYQFYDIVVNDKFRLFQGDPFRPSTPWGWKKIVKEATPGPQEARLPPGGGPR